MTTNPKLSSSYSLALDLSLDGGLDLHLADLRGKVEEDWYNSPRPCHDMTSDNSGVAEKERDIPCKPTFDGRADAIKSGGRRANKWTLYDEDEPTSGIYTAFESLVTPCGKSRLPDSHGNLQSETPSRGQGRDETHKFASWLLNDDDLSVGQKRKSEDFIIPPCSPLAQSFRKEGSLRFSAAATTRLGLSLELDGTRKSSKIGIGPTTSRPSDLLSEISKSGSKKPLFGTRDIDIRPSPSTLQCSDENPSESPFLSDLPPLKTRAEAIPQSLVHLSINTSNTRRNEVNQGGERGPTGVDDLYGLGSFDQVFITDQDLERAREKLPEEEIITPEETMQALLQKLIEAGSGKEESDTENDGKIEPLDPAEEEKTAIFEDIAIGCNWVTLGRGTLQAERATGTLRWTGKLVRIDEVSHSCTNDTDGEPSEGSSKVALLFPGQRLLEVRSKHVEGERPRVIVTVRKDGFPDAFVQFEFPTDQESQTNLCAEIASCWSMDRTEIEAVVRNLRVSDTDELLPDRDDIDEEPAEMSDEETDEEAHRDAIREACAQRDARILDAQRECEEQIQKLESDRLSLRYRRRKERRRASRSKGGDGTNSVDDMEISIANCAERSVAETKGSVIIETNIQTNNGVPGECQLCFTDEESQVLIPCGHRVCATCAVKLKEVTTKCPWDRVVYTKIDLIGQ